MSFIEVMLNTSFFASLGLLGAGEVTSTEALTYAGGAALIAGGTLVIGRYAIGRLFRGNYNQDGTCPRSGGTEYRDHRCL